MLSGSAAARHYGYSSARAKAMGSQLVTKKTMQEIINAKDISSMISTLYQGSFKKDIEEFGGLEIKQELIDFALSKNLAKDLVKLVQISPTTERKLMRAIAGKWELYNVKLVLEAKDRHQNYDSIARYVIDYGRYGSAMLKEVMREESIEGILNKFMINSPYREILKDALEVYKKNKSAIDAIYEIDRQYYKMLGSVIIGLRVIDNEAARIIKMEIDMKNIMLMVKAKRAGLKSQEIGQYMIEGGNILVQEADQIYGSSKDVESLISQVKQYDLKSTLDVYKSSKIKQLLIFEIGMKNSIFENAMLLLRHSILSFGAILAYAYMKEIEIYTLRIAISSRIYGLSKEETSRLIVWKTD